MPNTQLIFQAQDEWGTISVIDDYNDRILRFDDSEEQSRIRPATPYIPEHDYVQAMLAVLLFSQPKRALVLGLGGGCLVNALHHQVAGIHITAVELRQTVIDVAYRYFQLPRGKKIQILCQNANDYLAQPPKRKFDLVFTDLYNAQGADHSQTQPQFIEQCAQQLKQDGWLILNCWVEHKQQDPLFESLEQHFIDIRAIETSSGNWIIFAGKTNNHASMRSLRDEAQRLSKTLGFSLSRITSQLEQLH